MEFGKQYPLPDESRDKYALITNFIQIAGRALRPASVYNSYNSNDEINKFDYKEIYYGI